MKGALMANSFFALKTKSLNLKTLKKFKTVERCGKLPTPGMEWSHMYIFALKELTAFL